MYDFVAIILDFSKYKSKKLWLKKKSDIVRPIKFDKSTFCIILALMYFRQSMADCDLLSPWKTTMRLSLLFCISIIWYCVGSLQDVKCKTCVPKQNCGFRPHIVNQSTCIGSTKKNISWSWPPAPSNHVIQSRKLTELLTLHYQRPLRLLIDLLTGTH